MTPYSLARTIAAAVAQDTALQAWATENFSSELTVYLGLPSSDFPDVDNDAPFLAFGDPTRRASQNSRIVGFGLNAWMGLKVDGMSETEIENLIEPAGMEIISEGLQLLIDAVANALPANFDLTAADQATDTLGAHDYVEGFVAFEFENSLVIGEKPLS